MVGILKDIHFLEVVSKRFLATGTSSQPLRPSLRANVKVSDASNYRKEELGISRVVDPKEQHARYNLLGVDHAPYPLHR